MSFETNGLLPSHKIHYNHLSLEKFQVNKCKRSCYCFLLLELMFENDNLANVTHCRLEAKVGQSASYQCACIYCVL